MRVMVDGKARQRKTYVVDRGWGPVLCREETYDEYVVKEIQKSYGGMDVGGRDVLDLGGNIGAFSLWAVSQGAHHVMAYEPERHNAAMFRKNMHNLEHGYGGRITLHEKAVMPGSEGTTTLYVAPNGKNPGNTSTRPTRGRLPVEVAAESIQHVLRLVDPQCVKVDIEGGEYGLLPSIMAWPGVKEICLEYHLQGTDAAGKLFDQARDAHAAFCEAQWEVVRKPKLNNEKLWVTLAHYRR